MIDAADFLKWCEVFGIKTGGSAGDVTSVNLINSSGSHVNQVGNVIVNSNFVPQETYTPVNFTPMTGAGFAVNSITAMIKGIDLQLSSSNLTLQDGYDNGDGTITLIADKPLQLISTVAGFLLPSMTTTQFAAIGTLNNSEMAWDTELDRITVNANTDLDRRIETVAYLSDITTLESDAAYGSMRFIDNATPTTFGGIATPTQIVGTYTDGLLSGFTHASGTLTYTGSVTRPFNIVVPITSTYDGTSNNTTYIIYYNGSPITADKKEIFIGGVTPALIEVTLSTIIQLAENDFLQIFVQNEDSTDSLIVQDLTFNVTSIGGVSSGIGLTVVGEDYLDFTDDVLTANPINLNSSNVTGQLQFSNIADVTGTRLLGRYDSSTGTIEEIQLGANLSFTGDILNVISGASGTLQDAYTAGNTIVMQPNTPMDYSITSEDVMLESWFYNNNNPSTIPALLQVRKFKATDAGNLTFTGITQRALMVGKTSSASTYAFVDAMYEGGLSDVQNDYRSINSLRKQNEFYRSIMLQPGADNSSAGTCAFSSIFDVLSTTKGTRPSPMMSTSQVNSITSPVDALLAYDSTLHVYKYYNSTQWKALSSGTYGAAVETVGVMLTGKTSYTSGVQTSVIATLNGTQTIVGNSLAIGQSIELVAIGLTVGVTASGGSGIVTCKFGPLTFDSTTLANSLVGTGSIRSWNVTFKVTRVANTSISVSAAGFWEDASHVVQSMQLYSTPAVHSGFDFSVDNVIDLLWTMTASAGNAYNLDAINLTISKYN